MLFTSQQLRAYREFSMEPKRHNNNASRKPQNFFVVGRRIKSWTTRSYRPELQQGFATRSSAMVRP